MGEGICQYDIKANLAAIDNTVRGWARTGFSFNAGVRVVKAITDTVGDWLGHQAEADNKPFPDLIYSVVGRRLHWPGDRLSVETHLRRNIIWVKGRDGSKTEVDQARQEVEIFKQAQELALNLTNGQAVMYLWQATTNPGNGVGINQIRFVDGKLIQSSRILPFNSVDQINDFKAKLAQSRNDVSLVDAGDSGWMVMGEAVDFKDELPVKVDSVLQEFQSGLIDRTVTVLPPVSLWLEEKPAITTVLARPESRTESQGLNNKLNEPVSFWWQMVVSQSADKITAPTESNQSIGGNKIQELPEPDPILAATDFWFESTSAAAEKKGKIVSISNLQFACSANRLANQSEPVGQRESVVESPSVNKKEKSAEFKPTRTVPVGRKRMVLSGETSRTVLAGNSQVLFTAKKETEEVAVREKPPVQIKTTVIKNNNRPTAVSKLLMKSEQQIKADNPAVEIPEYRLPQLNFKPVFLNEKEMPIWQMYFIGQSKDLTMVVLAIFWLILNTKPLHITAGRGSGLGFYLRDLMFLEAEKN